MSYSIHYLPGAGKEYESSAQWYRDRSEQAAVNFSLAVNKKINILRTDPLRYRKSYKDFREVLLKKYPYNLIYLADEHEKQVIISSIYHHKRNPRTKYRKLR